MASNSEPLKNVSGEAALHHEIDTWIWMNEYNP